MNTQMITQLVAVVIGGLIAITGGFLSTTVLERRRQRQESRNLALAFRGEITAILELIRERNYIKRFQEVIEQIEEATSNAVHPGIIFTPLMRHLGSLIARAGELLTWPINRSVEQGAATQCYVATAPALAGVSGAYFADCNPARTSVHARNPELAARLWAVSEELARGYLPPEHL